MGTLIIVFIILLIISVLAHSIVPLTLMIVPFLFLLIDDKPK